MSHTTEQLVHDLAIVLGGALHPSAQLGPAPKLAARRLRDALGITPGELNPGIEDRIQGALAAWPEHEMTAAERFETHRTYPAPRPDEGSRTL